MLESAGGFPVYHCETSILDSLAPNFGNLCRKEEVARAFAVWERSDQCAIAGLDMEPLRRQILEECRGPGDFLRIFMDAVARKQGVPRWAEKTPMHLLFMREIKHSNPGALFVHIIRDGRDVALSLDHYGWVPPFPWDRSRSVLVAGIFWRWVVSRGANIGREIGPDYLEVHYENLLSRPQQTLDAIGDFIGQPLNYDKILRDGVGAVRQPTTSFGSDRNFIGRWQKRLTPEQLAQLEYLIRPALDEQGYECSGPSMPRRPLLDVMRILYGCRFEANHWAKMHALFSRRMAPLDRFEPGSPIGPLPRENTPPPERLGQAR